MEKVKRCGYWDCGWCYHEHGPKNGCVGSDKCGIFWTEEELSSRNYWRSFSSLVSWFLDSPKDWDMVAEYFTIK